MKYKIYELVEPDSLNRLEKESYMRERNELIVLREPKFNGTEYNEFDSVEAAYNYILKNEDDYKDSKYSILPYISIPY